LTKNFRKATAANLIKELPRLGKELKILELINFFLHDTNYFDYLAKNFKNPQERIENINELISFAGDFDNLPDFLERVSLLQSADAPTQSPAIGGRVLSPVNLMTIHLAKGLEFDNVFVIGCNEGILPHQMSYGSMDELEEERRLMYVAMTRARQDLCLSFYGTPSRFIYEIPPELTEFVNLATNNDRLPDEDEMYIEDYNKTAIDKIVRSLELKSGDTIIEIGPGKGALTMPLAGNCQQIDCQIIGIEKDDDMADQLARSMVNKQCVKIISGDVLEELPEITNKLADYKIVGNIPYYITGKILRALSELSNKPKIAILTVQKEVAERLSAKPDHMNLLAAAVQIWAEPAIISHLKASDFKPKPEVDSAIIKLETRERSLGTSSEIAQYYKFIKIVFKQPRKTLVNNLCDGLDLDKENIVKTLTALGLNLDIRPQNLKIRDILALVDKLA
jgi:16S rRNA (adenine1518-N6/adenine1519-N6)-dimethyltransferase